MNKRYWLGIALIGIVLTFVLWPARNLTEAERAVLVEVLPSDLTLPKIRVARAPLPPALTGFVIGNRITFRRGYYVADFSTDPYKMKQLVHEAGHVWINQRRGWWMGLAASVEHLQYGDDVYVYEDLSDPAGLRQEQIARLFEEIFWRRRLGEDTTDLESAILRVN